MFITLKPRNERPGKVGAEAVIARIGKKTARIPGARLILRANQDINVGGRQAKGQYVYALQSASLDELNHWGPLLISKLKKIPQIKDVNSDQQSLGLQANVVVDRDAASRLGVSPQAIDDTLYDAFGQRQVSTVYKRYNQHHVILEVDPTACKAPTPLRKSSSNPILEK